MNVPDNLADQLFQLMSTELRNKLTDISSEELGRMVVPMLMETSQSGRTRNIRIGSMRLLKDVLAELGTRKDCSMGAIEKVEGETEAEYRAKMDAQIKDGNNVKPLLDAIEKQIQLEEEAARKTDSLSVDSILNAPLPADLKGR